MNCIEDITNEPFTFKFDDSTTAQTKKQYDTNMSNV